MFQQPDPSGQLSKIFFGKMYSNNDQLKPFQNKKGQKNWGTGEKSSPFIRKKTAFFGPSYFEAA